MGNTKELSDQMGINRWPISNSKDVIKAYGEGDARIHALDGASFTVERGELAIILGASGAGKTTALNILGGMDTATSGTRDGGRA